MNCNIKNANYEKVLSVLENCLKVRYRNVCTCSQCISDIAATALNYLPPHYYVENTSNKEMGSPWVMVEAAVAEAIDWVIENPRHPPDAASSF